MIEVLEQMLQQFKNEGFTFWSEAIDTKVFTEDKTRAPLTLPYIESTTLKHWFKEMSWDGNKEVVLDAGCGSGNITAKELYPILPQGSLVLGIDICGETVTEATSEHGGTSGISFVVADIGSRNETRSLLGLDPGYSDGFTKVVSLYAMDTLLDLESGLVNLYSLLRPGGQALLAFGLRGRFYTAFKDLRASERWQEYFQADVKRISNIPEKDTEAELKEMLANVGFEVVRGQINNSYHYYKEIAWVKNVAKNLHPDIERVPENLRQDYLDDCVQIFKSAGALEECDRGFRMQESTIACILRKSK